MSLDIWLEVPQRCPNCKFEISRTQLSSFNYTHNVTRMWDKAGVYEALYESEGKLVTAEYIEVLRKGVQKFRAEYPEFEKLNSPNGWGLAKNALPWLERWLHECEENLGAIIRACR